MILSVCASSDLKRELIRGYCGKERWPKARFKPAGFSVQRNLGELVGGRRVGGKFPRRRAFHRSGKNAGVVMPRKGTTGHDGWVLGDGQG